MLTRPALAAHVRPWAKAILVVLGVACGGGGDTSPTPPPPPPPEDPVPATLAVDAGDGQEATPGSAVAVAPSVRVRDAAGQPVASVTVTFTVDSGGGSVATPTAVTNANGIAAAGSWTVGAEGPQVLLARVGNLPVVKIRATSRIATTVLTSGGFTPGGGTLTVTAPSSPLNGTQLIIPAGAVETPGTVTLSIRSTAGLVLKEGVAPVGPGLGISSTVGKLKKPAAIRIPVTPVAGKEMLLAVMNMTTRRVEILPPSGASGTSLTAMLPGLDGSIVEPTPGAAGRRPIARFAAADEEEEEEGFNLLLITLSVEPSIVGRPVETNFQMQRDNWDFDNLAVAWLPFLGVTGEDPSMDVIDPASGMVATALWYFENRKSDGPLFKRFRLQHDQLRSNKAGIRWSALASRFAHDQRAEASRNMEQWVDSTPAFRTLKQYAALKAMMYFAEDRPVPVLLYASADAPFAVTIGIAIRSTPHATGDDIDIYVPEHDLTAYRAQITAQGMVPFNVINRAGETYRIEMLSPMMRMSLLDNPAIASNWGAVVAGTVGDAEGWPEPELFWEKGKLDITKPVFLADEELVHWWKCTACPYFGNTFPGLPPNETHVQAVQMGRIVNGAMAELPANRALASIRWDADSVASDVEPTVTGQNLLLPQPALPDGQFPAGWLDWQQVTYRKVSLRPNPGEVELTGDVSKTFTLDPTQPLPAGTTFSWVFVSDDGRDSVHTQVPTHTRDFEGDTEGTLRITAHEATTRRAIARVEVPVTSAEPTPFWRITSFTDADDMFEDFENPPPLVVALQRLLTTPGAGLIGVSETGPGASELFLRLKISGTWDPAQCCPPPFTNDLKVPLGVQPAVHHSWGPIFGAWTTSSWTQSSTDLSTGTMTGRFAFGSETYPIADAGSQTGPDDGYEITATRNGKILTGVITFTAWAFNEDGEVDPDDPFVSWRFPFTATRIR